jgi:hypothetical protein
LFGCHERFICLNFKRFAHASTTHPGRRTTQNHTPPRPPHDARGRLLQAGRRGGVHAQQPARPHAAGEPSSSSSSS